MLLHYDIIIILPCVLKPLCNDVVISIVYMTVWKCISMCLCIIWIIYERYQIYGYFMDMNYWPFYICQSKYWSDLPEKSHHKYFSTIVYQSHGKMVIICESFYWGFLLAKNYDSGIQDSALKMVNLQPKDLQRTSSSEFTINTYTMWTYYAIYMAHFRLIKCGSETIFVQISLKIAHLQIFVIRYSVCDIRYSLLDIPFSIQFAIFYQQIFIYSELILQSTLILYTKIIKPFIIDCQS